MDNRFENSGLQIRTQRARTAPVHSVAARRDGGATGRQQALCLRC
jgi:hypothetical protein